MIISTGIWLIIFFQCFPKTNVIVEDESKKKETKNRKKKTK